MLKPDSSILSPFLDLFESTNDPVMQLFNPLAGLFQEVEALTAACMETIEANTVALGDEDEVVELTRKSEY